MLGLETKVVKELLSGVIAHFLLTVVHCGNFKNYRKVTSGLYGDRRAGHLYAENGSIFAVNAHSVIYLFAVPRFKLDYHIDLLRYLYGTHTEEAAGIYDTDATELQEMTDIFGR